MNQQESESLRNNWEISNMRKCINESFDSRYVCWLESQVINKSLSIPCRLWEGEDSNCPIVPSEMCQKHQCILERHLKE
jgi:hypothetical protein